MLPAEAATGGPMQKVVERRKRAKAGGAQSTAGDTELDIEQMLANVAEMDAIANAALEDMDDLQVSTCDPPVTTSEAS